VTWEEGEDGLGCAGRCFVSIDLVSNVCQAGFETWTDESAAP
jgi:hypothetical protein